jgi:DNA-binding transcriptional MocR family regulator
LEDRSFVRSFLDISRKRLTKGYQITTKALNEAGVTYYKGGNAGLFVYIDLSPYLSSPILAKQPSNHQEGEFAIAQHLLDNGVFLHPREEHNETPGWFRLVFASISLDELVEGMSR